jgi:hypothetical protein
VFIRWQLPTALLLQWHQFPSQIAKTFISHCAVKPRHRCFTDIRPNGKFGIGHISQNARILHDNISNTPFGRSSFAVFRSF